MSTKTVTTTGPEQIDLETGRSNKNMHFERAQPANDDTSLTRKTMFKVIAASISFFFAGNNDGSLGALTPYILRTYGVGTEYVALM
jgi:hypothetical protein